MPSEAKSGDPRAIKGADGRSPGLSTAFKENCRKAISAGLFYSGTFRVMRRFEGSHEFYTCSGARLPRLRRSSASKFGILCYHRIGTEGVPLHSKLKPQAFEAQMRYLKTRYRIVPLGQMCHELLSGDQVPPTVAITFDDGYRDLYTHALPVLQKYGIPATIYLIGRCMETGESPWYDSIFASIGVAPGASIEIETNGVHQFSLSTSRSRLDAAWEIVCYLRSIPDTVRQRWCAEFSRLLPPPAEQLEERMLDWGQVRAMRRAGISFGAHTMNHPAVSRLESAAYQDEFTSCKELLEGGLDGAVVDFAYPFGKLNDCGSAAQEFLVRAGYRSAVTTMEGFNSPGESPYLLRRLQISDEHALPLFAFNLSRMFFEANEEQTICWRSGMPHEPAPAPKSAWRAP